MSLGVVGALVRRPDLWRTALCQLRVLAPRGWWRRPPFLPRPSAGYLAWRAETMYGDPGAPIDGADLVIYLTWCRAERRHG